MDFFDFVTDTTVAVLGFELRSKTSLTSGIEVVLVIWKALYWRHQNGLCLYAHYLIKKII